jgi:hypothetical protein
MNPALIPVLLSALSTIIQDTPAAIALFNSVKTVLTQGSDPTPAQWQDLLASLAASHAKVQGVA